MNTRIALALIAFSCVGAALCDAKAQEASTDKGFKVEVFVAQGLDKALKAQNKANDRVAMWQGCTKDPAPCIADGQAKAQKAADRAAKKLQAMAELSK